jgi:hypothetical protein
MRQIQDRMGRAGKEVAANSEVQLEAERSCASARDARSATQDNIASIKIRRSVRRHAFARPIALVRSTA